MKKIAIIGAGGFTGQELLKILSRHEGVEVSYITSNEYAGQKLKELFPGLAHARINHLEFSPHPEQVSDTGEPDLVFLATPDKASMKWGAEISATKKTRVIDLGGPYRLKEASEFSEYYGIEHDQPAALQQAVYGLTEAHRDKVATASLVANPGCYPTAALVPLYAIGNLADRFTGPVIIDAKSGTSGAGGRKEKDNLGFSTVNENFRAYKVANHQHTPEIAQQATEYFGRKQQVRFTPYLLPLFRGILCTTYLQLKEGQAPAKVAEELAATLAEQDQKNQFLRYQPDPNKIELKNVQYTNYVDISFFVDIKNNLVMLVSAIDNLVKGAAGSAVQNMNVMLGFNEEQALL